MAYLNGKKLFQVVKVDTPTPVYKHRVKLQVTYSQYGFVVYADVYSNDGSSWVGSTCADEMSGWDGFIAGKGGQGDYLFQYMKCNNRNEATIYVDYADQSANYETIDSRELEIITDEVTRIS